MQLSVLLGFGDRNWTPTDIRRQIQAETARSTWRASVRRFPGPDLLGEAFPRAGMTDVRYRLLAGGIVALHVGEVVA